MIHERSKSFACRSWAHWWRAQIGSILPILALDFGFLEKVIFRPFPEGVNIIGIGLELKAATPEEICKMEACVVPAAKILKLMGAEIISFSCTAGSFILGYKHEQETIAEMKEATGVPCITMTTGVVEAFKFLGMKKIVMAAPYTKEVIEHELEYFKGLGFDLVYHEGLGIEAPLEIYARTCWQNYKFVLEAWKNATAKGLEADCIFISCGGMDLFPIISPLESATGLPVISSNSAQCWDLLKLAGIREPIYGYGKLLEMER